MFSQSVTEQAAQIAALEAQIDAALTKNNSYTYYSNSFPPTQDILLTTWVSTLGKSLPLPPETKFYWWDGSMIRGTLGTLYDYFAPLFSQKGAAFYNAQPNTYKWVTWQDASRLWLNASWFTATAGSFSDYTRNVRTFDQVATVDGTLSTAGEIIARSRVSPYDYVYNVGNNLRHKNTSSGTFNPSIGATTPRVAAIAVDGSGIGKWVFYRDSTNPNNVQRWTKAGNTTTTIVTGFTNLSHLEWDETSQKLLLFSLSGNTSAVSKCNFDGTGLTSLVPSGSYAGGYIHTTYHWVGEHVLNGFLYVPVPGSPYVNRYRKYDITAGTYVEEDFNFGIAKPIMEKAAKEAKTYFEASGGYQPTQQGSYWGTQFFAYPMERLVNFERSLLNDSWLLTYETGASSPLPGAQAGLAWAVLPDNGCSGKIYPLSEFTIGKADYHQVASILYDSAVKEMTLSWDTTLFPLDFRTLVIQFDNGLITATENIRIQFGGDTGANYEFTFWRNAVSTISQTGSTVGVPQNQIELYGINTTTVLGGKYILTFPDYFAAGSTIGFQIEGFTAAGVVTGTVNSILGTGKWARGAFDLNSIRIFLSGVTASFAANAKIDVYVVRGFIPPVVGGN